MTVGSPPTEWKSARWWQNRSLEERLTWAHLPPRWHSATYTADRLSLTNSYAIGEFLNAKSDSNGLFLYGPSGCGKTPTAVGLLRYILTSHKVSGRFITAERYVEMLKDQFDNDNELPEMYSMPHIVKYLKGVFDIVVLDAVGQERATEFSYHEIGSLLRRRNEDCRTTIVTTHLSPTEFIRRYGDRVASVLEDMTIVRVA